MTIDEVLADTRQRMEKSVAYYDRELRGIRTGRATTALIEYIKVPYYGNPTDLRELAALSVPEPTQLLVKPFDPGAKSEISKALETAELGLNPQIDGNVIRINVPAPSAERRKQLVAQVKKMAEDARVSIRNERRDGNKHIDQLVKDKSSHISEDEGKIAKENIEDLTKSNIEKVDQACGKKVTEVEEI
ncbi:MAG: ribosome recycling factor [Planctomycetota bacterium]|jgi:ribosome recycling factor